MIPKINPTNFTFELWRGGTLFDLGVLHYRPKYILEKKKALRKYAIGYHEAESLMCRPKINCTAVMFQKDDIKFWTHLTNYEFNMIFGDTI